MARTPAKPIVPDAIYSVGTATEVVPLAAKTIRKYLRAGVIKGKGRPWRIRGSELLKLA